jgi:hypothetical protein
MANSNRVTAVGVFVDQRQSQEAVADLKRAGFGDDQIGVVGRGPAAGPTGEGAAAPGLDRATGSRLGEGTGTGAAVGASLGALWGIAIAVGLLLAVGTVFVGGTLMAVLASAGGGAVLGTVIGALIGLGVPLDEAGFYEEEFRAGRTLAAVRAGGRHDEGRDILRRHGGYDCAAPAPGGAVP